MNKRRLLKLADMLEADAKTKHGIQFDFGKWGYVSDVAEPLSCGTQACALGLAAISGEFKRAGLGYRLVQGSDRIEFTFKGRRVGLPLKAAEKTFDLTDEEAEFLFIPRGGTGMRGAAAELAVAKNIRDFVAGEAAP